MTEQNSASWIVVISDAGGFLVDERSLDGGRGIDEGVGTGLRESDVELRSELFLNLQRPQVIESGDFSAHFHARPHVFAVIPCPRGKISLLRMEEYRFNPGNLIARVLCRIQQSAADDAGSYAGFAETAPGRR